MVGKINASFKICSIDLGHPVQEQFWDFCLSEIQTSARGGVKLEFVQNPFNSIRKLTIDLKRQKNFEKFDKLQFEIRSIRKKKFEKFANSFVD